MGKRSDLLDACFFGNRWAATHQPAAGTTVVVQSPVATDATSRHHLELLTYSIKNMVGAGAAIATVTATVRNASIAGTVLWSTDHLVAPSTSANVQIACMGFPGKRGSRFFISMSTVVASVIQSMSAAGWIEDTNG